MSLCPSLLTILLTILSVSDCRVKFTHSSVYDDYDFIGKTRVDIEECSNIAKCVIYVSVIDEKEYKDVYENIVLTSEDGTWNLTVNQLAEVRNENTKEIDPYYVTDDAIEPSSKIFFSNSNDKQIAAPLVIYAVNMNTDPNFSDTAGVFDAADIGEGINQGRIVTILSAKPFTTTIKGDKNTVATIFATGYDNADSKDENPDNCRRIMQTRFDDIVQFQINGPIASIYFSDFWGNLSDSMNNIKTSLTFSYTNLELKSRGFVTSQGYVGCESGQVYSSSLYQKFIQYSLFSQDTHYVHQTIFLNTDLERPLNVHNDFGLRNFVGTDLLESQQVCDVTHKLEVNFNQSGVNSYALVYSYSDVNCEDEVVTVPSTPKTTQKTTTARIFTTAQAPVKSTTAAAMTSTTTPEQITTKTIGVDPTTSSSIGFVTLSLLISVVHGILMR